MRSSSRLDYCNSLFTSQQISFGETAACPKCCCKTVMPNQLQNFHLSCSSLFTVVTCEIQT
ncbi:hypothetical protein LDENG_00190170 [Lucifuga dentata]|nr:hypothetical protein LDENG_00190170 [Lucifuga dentata]